jgi:hypothetical protein
LVLGSALFYFVGPKGIIMALIITAIASGVYTQWLELDTREKEIKRNMAKQEREHRIRMSKLEQ